MLIHIGFDDCVNDKELVAILKKEGMTAQTSAFIDRVNREGRLSPCPRGERSYLLLCGGGGESVKASCIRSVTLKDRFLADYSDFVM